VTIAGVALVLDCDGALYWPDAGLLAISDLHLEKGSSFAARGVLLPPMTPPGRWRGLPSSLLATRHRR
jgi:metallophosphoesterase superfamily enzyme